MSLVSPPILTSIRIAVLSSGEGTPDKWWNSSMFSESGQADLGFIFPHTSLACAVTHATSLAQAHHDRNLRSRGVSHLFRLPTSLERGISKELLDLAGVGLTSSTDPWAFVSDLPAEEPTAHEGSIDLGKLAPESLRDLALLAHTYKRAFEKDTECTPFFTLS